jgi:hypothetical protein
VRRGGSLTLADLRKRPAVLIGLLNNRWTMQLVKQLRFYFEHDQTTNTAVLRDKQHPEQVLWRSVPPSEPYSKQTVDCAIIARFVDKDTEQTVLLLAGYAGEGTAAAGEFVTEPKYLALLAASAPSNWSGENIQIAIATDVINGSGGPPRILAAHFW